MTRKRKILLWSTGSLVVIIAACIVFILTFDWNRARPWINQRVSQAIGRTFAIQGNLAVAWHRPQERENGWRGWIPWPYLEAQNITVGNPDWVKTAPYMASVGKLAFSINPLALLDKKIIVPALTVGGPEVLLEHAADGKNNWTFTASGNSAWKLELDRLELDKGSVHVIDAIKHADIQANIDTINDTQNNADARTAGIRWTAKGKFNHEPVSGNGKAGNVLSLRQQTTPYPIEASVHIGKTHIDAKGTLTKPSELAALDMRLKLSGVSMAQLYPITGVVLPETPPFATEGHLIGKIDAQHSDWVYEKFTGRVGGSDLSGNVEYQLKAPRPLLTGNVVSNLLRFEDLAPLVGADSNAQKVKRDAAPVQPTNKVLPVEEFKTERWKTIDTDIKFTARKIIRDKNLPIDNLTANIQLKNGVLKLNPLDFGVAGGNLVSTINLDAREKLIRAEMKISARHLKLHQLFPGFEPMKTSLGEVHGDASLSGIGNSVAALLGSSNGEIKAVINQGAISKLLLEEIGLNIGNIVLTKLFGDKQVNINCVASDFGITNGVMQSKVFLVDTEEAVLNISGNINLVQEQLDLTIKPAGKSIRIISLRAPLYVKGSFKDPKVSVDKGILLLKAGGAIALGALAPITALIPLINVGPDQQSQCGKLLADAASKPVAPPPGKTQPLR